jgi:predicted phosphodiesterase
MRQYGVQALFYGHDHVFTDKVVDSIHYICVGSAGAPWKFGTGETGYEKFWTASGYTWVEVGLDSLKVSFIRPDDKIAGGVVVHSFEIPAVGSSGLM